MFIDLKDLFWLTLTALACWFWWQGQKAKERALRRVRRQCDELDIQLLDDNIALRAVWLKRNAAGRLCFWRRYHFEFTSTGDERYSGRIVTLGHEVTDIDIDPHRLN